jgi:hypothetical protein
MTYYTDTPDDYRAGERAALSRKAIRQTFFGGVTLACAGSICVWILNASLNAPNTSVRAEPSKVVDVKPVTARAVLDQYASLFDSTSSLGAPPTTFAVPSTFESRWASVSPAAEAPKVAMADTREVAPPPTVIQEIAEAVPLPSPRPAALRQAQNAGPSRQDAAQANKVAALAPPPAEKPLTIFERLFGRSQPASGQTLAYAAPDGGVLSDGQSVVPGRYERDTAVYDITARTVYLPDGTKLEAHSGLGSMLDDPRHVDQRMRGPTPPATYNLSMRESLFHGVEALRLTPVDSSVFGRTGLLAHTYMLGPNGDSNGCVSFRDYNRFLQAYKRQQIKRLVVVARL